MTYLLFFQFLIFPQIPGDGGGTDTSPPSPHPIRRSCSRIPVASDALSLPQHATILWIKLRASYRVPPHDKVTARVKMQLHSILSKVTQQFRSTKCYRLFYRSTREVLRPCELDPTPVHLFFLIQSQPNSRITTQFIQLHVSVPIFGHHRIILITVILNSLRYFSFICQVYNFFTMFLQCRFLIVVLNTVNYIDRCSSVPKACVIHNTNVN